jgi:hypothetical protein
MMKNKDNSDVPLLTHKTSTGACLHTGPKAIKNVPPRETPAQHDA